MTKYNYGYAYIGCVVIVLSLNMSIIVYEQINSVSKALKKRKYTKAWKKYEAELEAQKEINNLKGVDLFKYYETLEQGVANPFELKKESISI